MLFSLHLLETSPWTGARLLARRWVGRRPPGMAHAEQLWTMELGAPVVSPRRVRLGRVAMVAAWESAAALDAYLAEDPAGRAWARGWHVRLAFLRRWGHVAAFDAVLPPPVPHDLGDPVVVVTLARLRHLELPRFVRWGRPVEVQVRDHPATTLALAAAAPTRTVATFTAWTSAAAMVGMVGGDGDGPAAHRHVEAMRERDRRDFHHEFTTLRFRCLEEHGAWQGRSGIVPVTPTT